MGGVLVVLIVLIPGLFDEPIWMNVLGESHGRSEKRGGAFYINSLYLRGSYLLMMSTLGPIRSGLLPIGSGELLPWHVIHNCDGWTQPRSLQIRALCVLPCFHVAEVR